LGGQNVLASPRPYHGDKRSYQVENNPYL
jgi:hypothetical protein